MSQYRKDMARSLGIKVDTIVEALNPNRMGDVVLVKVDGEFCCYWREVMHDGYGDYDGPEDWDGTTYPNEAMAREHFNELVASIGDRPNWTAQAEYDREHGTDNGYDPQILAWDELHANEMDVG